MRAPSGYAGRAKCEVRGSVMFITQHYSLDEERHGARRSAKTPLAMSCVYLKMPKRGSTRSRGVVQAWATASLGPAAGIAVHLYQSVAQAAPVFEGTCPPLVPGPHDPTTARPTHTPLPHLAHGLHGRC